MERKKELGKRKEEKERGKWESRGGTRKRKGERREGGREGKWELRRMRRGS